MKVKVDNMWFVATGFGGVAVAQTYEQACVIEKNVHQAGVIGFTIVGVLVLLVVIGFIIKTAVC